MGDIPITSKYRRPTIVSTGSGKRNSELKLAWGV